jgi:hypothetical protein
MEILSINPPHPLLLHIPLLFRLRIQLLMQFCARPIMKFEKRHLIQVLVSSKTTILLNIFCKRLVLCQPLKFYRTVKVNVEPCCYPLELWIPRNQIQLCLIWIILRRGSRTTSHSKFKFWLVERTSITLFWMREPPPMSFVFLSRNPLVLLNLPHLLPP